MHLVLNIFASSYDLAHWPEPERTRKRQQTIDEARVIRALCSRSDRIVPCVDLPLSTVAALLRRCRYFLGVDNGIKHVAWALGVPHTMIVPSRVPLPRLLRWMPDVHRALPSDCTAAAFERHIAEATARVTDGHVRVAVTR
jgi:ADP-heptose:LPS heptosyltransferase